MRGWMGKEGVLFGVLPGDILGDPLLGKPRERVAGERKRELEKQVCLRRRTGENKLGVLEEFEQKRWAISMFGSILEVVDILMLIGVRTLKTLDTFMTPEFSSYIQILDCHLRTMCLHVFRSRLSLESHSWRRVRGRLIRSDSHQSSDSSVEMSDELASTLASIQEFMAGVSRPGVSLGTPFHLVDHYETIPPPTVIVPPPMVPTIEDTRLAEQEARVERLESRIRQIRLQDGGLTWDDRDGISASLPAKFRMPHIEHYSGIGFMRAHGIDDAQLVALFPMSLSGAAQRCADIDVSRRELEATRQRPDESISSFVTRWRAKMAGMIDRPKEQDQIDMVLWNLQPRFARRLVGIPFQDLKSLVHAAFSVEEAIARGLWTDTTPSPDSKGKKPIGSFSRSGEASMQPRPSHPRATTHPPPRPYAKRPARQFTPLGMTLTRAFEKLKDGGLIVHLAPRPLPHPIPPYFRSHEHCLYHQMQGHDTERWLVNLVGPSVTTNPLPTHSTHAVEDLVQSTWIHYFAAVHFRAPFHPDYGRHQNRFCFVEFCF
ncbi:hypothetical protein AAG906_037237 [Vitis piasezkii]